MKNKVVYNKKGITLYHGDYRMILQKIPTGSIDLICTDPPYGVTDAEYDERPDMYFMWHELKRVLKANGVCVLFSQQPFTTDLIAANRRMFRTEYIWHKHMVSNFLNARRVPLRQHENILVFSGPKSIYVPQMRPGKPYKCKGASRQSENYRQYPATKEKVNKGERFPTTIITDFPRQTIKDGHPQEKSINLVRFLIRTYSRPGELVLDFSSGGGTTLHAAHLEGRKAIGIEIQKRWIERTINRLSARKKTAAA